MITVTIEIDWNVTAVRKSIPASYTTQVSNGTVLVDILNKAAGENKQGPYNRYSTTYYAGLGHMIIAMNGSWQEPGTSTYWMIYDKGTGELTPLGVDSYKPHNKSTTVFNLTSVSGHSSQNASYSESERSGRTPRSNEVSAVNW